MLKTEARIQQESIQWFRNSYGLKHHDPQFVMFSVPNEGRDVVEQMKKKATGMLKGAADTIIILQGKTIYCEFKDSKGRQQPEQIKFQDKVEKLNQQYWLVRSLEEFQVRVKEELNLEEL